MVEAELIFRKSTLEYGGVDKETMGRRRRSVMGGRLALLEFQLKKAASEVVDEMRQVSRLAQSLAMRRGRWSRGRAAFRWHSPESEPFLHFTVRCTMYCILLHLALTFNTRSPAPTRGGWRRCLRPRRTWWALRA